MDIEGIKKEFGYKGKPKQWQIGFDALLRHMPDYVKAEKAPVAKSPAAMAGYGASLERPSWKVKIRGDAGIYEIWSIDWLNQTALVYRACGDEWVPLSKLSIAR